MTKQEIITELKEVENTLYQNSYCYNDPEEKILKRRVRKLKKQLQALSTPLVPGTEISLEDFLIQMNKTVKKDTVMTKFFKEEQYRYVDQEKEILRDMLNYEYGIFAWFNKNYCPTDIKRIKGETIKQPSKSNNIYDVMCAPQTTEIRDEFKITLGWNQQPITVFKEYTKNTTLSMSEVRSFM